MLKAIRRNLTPPTALAVVALVFAMTGGAFAAKNAAGPAEASKQSGKRGPKGPRGPRGPQGPKGDTGARGAEGPQGPKGDTGDPWTAGGFLPSGASLGGTWAVIAGPEVLPTKGVAIAPISFGLPLKGTPTVVFVKKNQGGVEHAAECPGSILLPKAAKGYLCLYAAEEAAGMAFQSGTGSPLGGVANFLATPGTGGGGVWTVTAP